MKNEHQTGKDGIKKEPSMPNKSEDDTSSGNAVFDWDGLVYRLMGDEALAEEIIGDFLKQIPINLDALKQSLDKNDALQVKREAHVIKGSAGNIGAVVLQEIAEKIEKAGDLEDLIKAKLFITEFDAQLEIFKKELDRRFR
jgi:HPt (histidine-containing phosphotransfer) domain-containing protein